MDYPLFRYDEEIGHGSPPERKKINYFANERP